jgi:hypothetical protein
MFSVAVSGPKARDIAISHPKYGALTQGTIFTCAVADSYDHCETFGLVITARCDAANDKVWCYNYVPIVHLDDWVHRDGRLILAGRLLADSSGALRKALSEAALSPAILETEQPRTLLDTIFDPTKASAKVLRARERFAEVCERYELANDAFLAAPADGTCLKIAKVVPHLKDNVVAELVHQRLAGYYFFDRVAPDRADTGYVALLRQVQILPKRLAHEIARGLAPEQFSELCAAQPAFSSSLFFSSQDLAMPIALVSSPHIEHFMQSFALLFSRIGINDPDPSYVAELWTRQASVVEAK